MELFLISKYGTNDNSIRLQTTLAMTTTATVKTDKFRSEKLNQAIWVCSLNDENDSEWNLNK